MARLDLLVTGARVIDGSGAPAREGDVGAVEGRVVILPPDSGASAREVLRAEGHVVAPGFIDVHTHSDLLAGADHEREELRLAPLLQGVTTEVCGNCGISPFPSMPSRLSGLEELLTATFGPPARAFPSLSEFVAWQGVRRTNLAALVGHGTLRAGVVGFAERPATEDELALMCALLDEALTAGAAGLSTGLIYVPGTHADTEEVITLARVAARHGKPYVTHLRDEMSRVEEALEEALVIARAAGAALQVSHHKTAGPAAWGLTERTLGILDAASKEGLDVRCDVYPYTAGSTSLHAMLPPWTSQRGVAGLLAAIAEPQVRDRIRRDISDGLAGWENTVGNGGWGRIAVASAPETTEVQGLTIAALAARQHTDPVDVACDLLLENRGNVTIVSYSMSEADVRRVLTSPLSMIGSDGVPKLGLPHPRWAGTFPRVLGHYVREEGLMSLERGVHKMTGAAAQRFGLRGRGRLEEGAAADLVVFDPTKIDDAATYDRPLLPPRGIRMVIVGGHVVVDDGWVREGSPGRVLAV